MKQDALTNLRAIRDSGFRPGEVAVTPEGAKVWIFSHPYTDGESILILGQTDPDDLGTWKEFHVSDLTIVERRTPE